MKKILLIIVLAMFFISYAQVEEPADNDDIPN